MKKMLILGVSGLVGTAIAKECKDFFEVYGSYVSSTIKLPIKKQIQLHVGQIEKLRETIQSVKPDIVISCLRGEFSQQLEFHKELALQLVDSHTILYFFSTTNVFDGDFSRFHSEIDIPFAESDYGNYKIQAENIVREMLGERAVIIRIPSIWGKESLRMNIVKEGVQKNQVINVYRNLIRDNLLDTLLAKQLRFMIEKELKGIIHLRSVDKITEAEFYERLLLKLTGQTSQLKHISYGEPKTTYYFGLNSNRYDIPQQLQCTNDYIINELTKEEKF
ncbi:MAG: sugar nucleotide-binding protein [Bacillota bacterium]|nr:sugar nucleotide-binding protein [Bacillota bacterium]